MAATALGIADLHRRCEVSLGANLRYIEALNQISGKDPIGPWIEQICRPILHKGRRYRALNHGRLKIWRCCKPSCAESSLSTAWATATCADCSMARRRIPRLRDQ